MYIKQKGEDMKIIDKIIDFVKSIFIHPELLVEGQETKVSEQKINNFMESLQKDTQNQLYKNEILDEIAESHRDKIYPVYIDELRNSGFLAGRSDNNALVQIKGDESLLGKTVNIKITNPKRLSLYGERVL